MRSQQLDNWCWAAIMQAVLLKREGRLVPQAQIASVHTGDHCSTDDSAAKGGDGECRRPCPLLCNDRHRLKQLLIEEDLLLASRPIEGNDHRALIKAEIDAGRPVPLMIYTVADDVHFTIIGGYTATAHDIGFQLYVPVEDRQAWPLSPISLSWAQLDQGFVLKGVHWFGAHIYQLRM